MSFFWQIHSFFYDLMLSKWFPYQNLTENLFQALEVKGNDRILDAGCGTGHLIKKINEFKGDKIIQIEAIDFNPRGLKYAKRRCKNLPDVHFDIADLNKPLRFQDNTFDKIVSCNVLYALKKPEIAISEFYRLLKLGGKLVITNPKPNPKGIELLKEQIKCIYRLKPFSRKLYHSLFFVIIQPLSIVVALLNKAIMRKGEKGEYHFLSKEQWGNLLQNKGFKNIQFRLAYADQNLLVTANK